MTSVRLSFTLGTAVNNRRAQLNLQVMPLQYVFDKAGSTLYFMRSFSYSVPVLYKDTELDLSSTLPLSNKVSCYSPNGVINL